VSEFCRLYANRDGVILRVVDGGASFDGPLVRRMREALALADVLVGASEPLLLYVDDEGNVIDVASVSAKLDAIMGPVGADGGLPHGIRGDIAGELRAAGFLVREQAPADTAPGLER
jgi:hypothetical protein